MHVTCPCPDCGGDLGRADNDRNTLVCTECLTAWVLSITAATPRPNTPTGSWEDGEFAGLIWAVMDADQLPAYHPRPRKEHTAR